MENRYLDTWETWRKGLFGFSLVMWPVMVLWLGIPTGIAMILSLTGIVYSWRPVNHFGDPRLGSYTAETLPYKVAAFFTTAQSFFSSSVRPALSSLKDFIALFGPGVPFDDPWHKSKKEEEDEAEGDDTLSALRFRPWRLSFYWSLVFGLLMGLVELGVTMVTPYVASWQFALPFPISYPLSAFGYFLIAQFYCLVRLTQGKWGEAYSMLPRPAIMLDRVTWSEHLRRGILTWGVATFGIAIFALSFIFGTPLPVPIALAMVAVPSLLIFLITVSFMMKKPWAEPWEEHIGKIEAWSGAFAAVLGDDNLPDYIAEFPFPTEEEMKEIREEEGDDTLTSSINIATFSYPATGVTWKDLEGIDESLSNSSGYSDCRISFAKKEDEDGDEIDGTISGAGFRVWFSTEERAYNVRDLMDLTYKEWEVEHAILGTVVTQLEEYLGRCEIIDHAFATSESSPSQLLMVTLWPIRGVDVGGIMGSVQGIQKEMGVSWLRVTRHQSDERFLNVLLSNNPHDPSIEFERNAFWYKRLITQADWEYYFTEAGITNSEGLTPILESSAKSTELVTTAKLTLPAGLDYEEVRFADRAIRATTGKEFVEVNSGWAYTSEDSDARKQQAKSIKSFSVLSAPSDPLNRMFKFGDYRSVALKERTKDNRERVEWIPGIMSDDQPAFDSFVKGDAPHLLTAGESGSGKPLDPNTPIRTKRGWTTLSDVNTNDYVMAPDGSWTKVTWVGLIHDVPESYAVTMEGADEAVHAAGHHLWIVERDVEVAPPSGRQRELLARLRREVESRGPARSAGMKMLNSTLSRRSEGVIERLVGEPITVAGDTPMLLNNAFPHGVSEASPQAGAARSLYAMQALPAPIAAVLFGCKKNEFPDGHIVVGNIGETKRLFSAAGYTVTTMGSDRYMGREVFHVFVNEAEGILSKIDYANAASGFITVALSWTARLTGAPVADVAQESMFALLNVLGLAGMPTATASIGAGTGETIARMHQVLSASHRSCLTEVTDSTLTISPSGSRECFGDPYEICRAAIAKQTIMAQAALDSLVPVSEGRTYLSGNSELRYFLLRNGVPVNLDLDNGGIIDVEYPEVLDRRFTFASPDRKESDIVLELLGIIAACGTVTRGNEGEGEDHATLSILPENMETVRTLEKAVGEYGLATHSSERSGEYFAVAEILGNFAHLIHGNVMSMGVGYTGECVTLNEDGTLETLFDMSTLAGLSGLSFGVLSVVMANVDPDSNARTSIDMLDPTGRTPINVPEYVRPMWRRETVLAAIDAHMAREATESVTMTSVVTTMSLATQGGSWRVPVVGGESVAVNAEPLGEESRMMCISVEHPSRGFMVGTNGMVTHNSVFVQSGIAQMGHNNHPQDLTMDMMEPKIGLQRFALMDNVQTIVDPWNPSEDFFLNLNDLFQDAVQDMVGRNKILASYRDPETGVPPEKLSESRDIARKDGHSKDNPHEMMIPYRLLYIEECATVFADAGSSEEAEYQAQLLMAAARIAREGRSAGVFEIAMTQYPTNASIPSVIRNQMRRLGLKCRNGFASNIIIDENGLEDLKLPGSAMARDDNNIFRRLRGFLLENGRPSEGGRNDIMEVLEVCKKDTTQDYGLKKDNRGKTVVDISMIPEESELLYNEIWVNKKLSDAAAWNKFSSEEGKSLDSSISSGEKTDDYDEKRLNRDMKKKGQKSSAPWLAFDEKTGAPKSTKPKPSGRRATGRKSRITPVG